MKNILIILISLTFTFVSYALKPDRVYNLTPDSLGLDYTMYLIETPDKAKIKVWFLNAHDSVDNGNTLILSYGDAGNMSYWLNQAVVLNQNGYSVVLFDYRGFGGSSDFEMNPNQLYYNEFSTDLISVIKWSKQNLSYNKLGLLSFSMGTIMSTIAAQTEQVDFIVGEGFVFSPAAIQAKIFQLKQKEIILPSNSDEYEHLIKKIEVPMLLYSGSKDVFTTLIESKEIVSQKANRTLIEFAGNHLEGFSVLSKSYYGELYVAELDNFIQKI